MFDNGSFLRRRKRYKRASLSQSLPFPTMFSPFTPFWVRKPVPVIPVQFNNAPFSGFRESLHIFPRSDLFHTRNECQDSKLFVGGDIKDNLKTQIIDNQEQLENIRRNIGQIERNSINLLSRTTHKNSVDSLFEPTDQNINKKNYNPNNIKTYIDYDVEEDDTNDKIDVESESDEYPNELFHNKFKFNLSDKNNSVQNQRQFKFYNNTSYSPHNKDINKINTYSNTIHKLEILPSDDTFSNENNIKIKCKSVVISSSPEFDSSSDRIHLTHPENLSLSSTYLEYVRLQSNEIDEITNLDYELSSKRKLANAKGFSIENLIGRTHDEG